MSHALHGSTTFVSILIGQVLVVSSLSLMTIWLLVRRARYAGTQNSGRDNPISNSAPAANFSVTESPEYLELEKKFELAQAEQAKLATMKEQYTALEEKVKFLESKLLEYEILQEEIGTLSLLKIENEKLKKEVSKLQKEIERRVGGGKGAAEAESESAPESEAPGGSATPKIEESVASPSSEPSNPASSEATAGVEPLIATAAISDEISADELANLATVSFAPEPAVSAPATPAPNPEAFPDAGGGLDGLLSEIDKLTSESDPPKS